VYRLIYRHALTRLDPESAHHAALRLLRVLGGNPAVSFILRAAFAPAHIPVRVLGRTFPNPLGLAAGFDKNAECIPALGALGFGHIEVGTVTPRPQPGNPRPRLFRLTDDSALINRLGFPSEGMDAVADRLAKLKNHRHRPVLGISLGKNKDTPLLDAHADYTAVLRKIAPHADFFVVNVSSPNTPDLRKLQTREYLDDLLARLDAARRESGNAPLLVKISPDLSWGDIDTVTDLALVHGLEGIIATNTTIERPNLHSAVHTETGGLSGVPLRARSTEIVRRVYQRSEGKLTVIGVGGIFTGDDAWEKIRAGASLVQAYTGFIYGGMGFAQKVTRRIAALMRRDGITDLAQVVGADIGHKKA
jgi:dihydroorotate dehydrogenase